MQLLCQMLYLGSQLEIYSKESMSAPDVLDEKNGKQAEAMKECRPFTLSNHFIVGLSSAIFARICIAMCTLWYSISRSPSIGCDHLWTQVQLELCQA